MTAKHVSVRFSPGLAPSSQARLVDLIATALGRYLRADVDCAADERMYVAMAPDASEAIQC